MDLLARKMAGELSEHEWGELQFLLSKHPEWSFLYNEMQKPVDLPDNSQELAEQSFASHYVSHMLLAERKSQGHGSDYDTEPVYEEAFETEGFWSWNRMGKPTALLALLGGLMLLGWFMLRPDAASDWDGSGKMNEMITQKGSRSKIILPDGTSVILNADSRITYGQDFAKNRELSLTGEAFFDVVHDPEHPFVIKTEQATVRVLGTALNVRSYKQDQVFETALIRGKIEVSVEGLPDKKIVLLPNEKVRIVVDSTLGTLPAAAEPARMYPREILVSGVTIRDSIITETSWLEGRLSFVNKPLRQIARELERQFNTTIEIRNDAVGEYRYTGLYDQAELQDVLEILKLSKPFDYEIENKKVIIK
ncbi:MAG TPA: FecR domain-containing protein [Flavihumibacter sp.]